MIIAINQKNSKNNIYFTRNYTMLNKYKLNRINYQTYLVDIRFNEIFKSYNNYGYTNEYSKKMLSLLW